MDINSIMLIISIPFMILNSVACFLVYRQNKNRVVAEPAEIDEIHKGGNE